MERGCGQQFRHDRGYRRPVGCSWRAGYREDKRCGQGQQGIGRTGAILEIQTQVRTRPVGMFYDGAGGVGWLGEGEGEGEDAR